MLARVVLIVSLCVMIAAAITWYRGGLDYQPSPSGESRNTDKISMNQIYPGGGQQPLPEKDSHYEESGYDVTQGEFYYNSYNCVGCHAHGGGGIGPALMDDKWIYGSSPANIYETIVEGRPNGMPSFRGKIPEAQIWQIVAYVRSLSGLTPSSSTPARDDQMQYSPPPNLQPKGQTIQAEHPQ